jgi:uncharacterized YigZ family protein
LSRSQYKTVKKTARIEIEERKSRFIAICGPVDSEQAAQEFINAEKTLFPDASHHVYAWIIGGSYSLQRFSDDREPKSTAGRPVLEALLSRQLEQAAVVVTRYFGGTLLGTGGLSRAYGQAAALAVEKAGPVTYQLCRRFDVTVEYSHLDRLKRAFTAQNWVMGTVEFGIDVTVPVAVIPQQIDQLHKVCADLTGGGALLEAGDLFYQPIPPHLPPSAQAADSE